MLHDLMTGLWATNAVSGPLPYTVLVLGGALVGFLATQSGLRTRQAGRRRARGVVVAAAAGVVASALIYWLVAVVWNPFGIPVPDVVLFYFCALGAGVGVAVLSLQRARWWRRVVSVIAVVSVGAAASLASAAAFGLTPTLGSFVGRAPAAAIEPLSIQPFGRAEAVTDLASTWHAPPGMPEKGRLGSVQIPAVHSGFGARDAGLYLPPAALVEGAPKLPLMIMMMGQPGDPDPQYVGKVLDEFAARHDGLAPIVVVADQLGDPSQDPGCSDSARFGKAETYITKDVVEWADANLHVQTSGASRTIGGYSNGGACALLYAARYPEKFGNLLDISGEIYPGSENPDALLQSVFDGDQAAYDAQKPETVLATHRYPGSVAVFTAGSDDPVYVAAARAAQAAASAAGFGTRYAEIPHGGHVLGAIMGGFENGFTALYPRLGLG
ncbi:alpha/beta hydrolase [Frigoribacterium sp. 2-23]|uniref:alpha/beta hydrolase n=1 Tax=Frigoribacterium sp. 2-23 TaxID=3415006 RepID=UPI003C6F5217